MCVIAKPFNLTVISACPLIIKSCPFAAVRILRFSDFLMGILHLTTNSLLKQDRRAPLSTNTIQETLYDNINFITVIYSVCSAILDK